MVLITGNCQCSICSINVIGNDDAIKREFERIERRQAQVDQIAESSLHAVKLETAYMRFEEIAADMGTTITDIINAQTKTPSADTDGV